MNNFKSVWCDIELPANLKANSRITSSFINGENENGYTYGEVSAFITTADQVGVQTAVDSLIAQSGDEHHVFIEDLEYNCDGSFEVWLGS